MFKSKTNFVTTLVLTIMFAVTLSFQGCEDSTVTPPVTNDTAYSFMRFINSSYNAGAFSDAGGYVDVWIDGRKVLASFDYTAESGPLYMSNKYIQLKSDSSRVIISEMNSTIGNIDTLVAFKPSLDSAGIYTLVIPGNKTDWQNLPSGLILKRDTTSAPNLNNIWIRGIHAYNSNGVIPNNTRVDIHADTDPTFTPSNATRLGTLQFRGVSQYYQVPAGSWTIKVTAAGSFNQLLSATIIGIGGKIYSVIPSGFSDVGPGAPRIDAYLDN